MYSRRQGAQSCSIAYAVSSAVSTATASDWCRVRTSESQRKDPSIPSTSRRDAERRAACMTAARVRPNGPDSSTVDRRRFTSRRVPRMLSPGANANNGEANPMGGLEIKNFDSADETRPFADKGEARIVNLGDHSAL